MRECQCGCGAEVTSKDQKVRFINGHHTIWLAKQGTPHRKRYVPRPEEIPSGWCECGCGGRTSIYPMNRQNCVPQRFFRGHPVPFILGHTGQKRGAENPAWRGGRRITVRGYVLVYAPRHPRAHKGCVLEHRLVMESVLGRLLLPSEDVHHLDGDKQNNRPENLELMGHAEHMSHHRAEERAAGIVRPQTSRRRSA